MTAWKEAVRNRLSFSEHLSVGGGWGSRMAGKWRNPGGGVGLWTRVPLPWASQVVLVVKKKKKITCQSRRRRDMGSIPGSGRSHEGGRGNLLP